jgi:hypothetical protein
MSADCILTRRCEGLYPRKPDSCAMNGNVTGIVETINPMDVTEEDL